MGGSTVAMDAEDENNCAESEPSWHSLLALKDVERECSHHNPLQSRS